MVMLVALRLAIGWHFFKEGLSHRTDPTWTSEGFLKQAKGPLAAEYQAVLPKFHDWDRLILSPLPDNSATSKEEIGEAVSAKDTAVDKAAADKSNKADKPAKPATAYDDWLTQVKNDWKTDQDAFANFYKLTDEQKAQAAEIDKKSTQQMEELLKGDAEDIRLYRELVYRAQMMQATAGGGEIPFIKSRAAVVQKNPVGEAGLAGTSAVISSSPPAWEADAKGIEKLRHMRLDDLLTADQRKLGEQPPESAKLHKIDTAVSWLVLGVGACLIVGLFTRLAAVAGAAFLLSVICSQPPWIAESVPTYSHVIECLALLALATTAVGRWGGLDYFIHLLVKPFCCGGRNTKA
jgi:uncharacterized membrane protein YphA (DoxX/SURF4 family)